MRFAPSPLVRQTASPFPGAPASAGVRVDLLAALFTLWGTLTVLVGLSTLALALGGISLLSESRRASPLAAGVTVAAFAVMAVMAVIWGAVHIVAGLSLARRRAWSRTAGLVLGSVDLVLLPYGTLLGCYALWTLLREDGRRVFPTDAAPARAEVGPG